MSVGPDQGLIAGVDLLSGPRGRRLCLELVQRADEEIARTLFHLADAAEFDQGGSAHRVVFTAVGSEPSRWENPVRAATVEHLVDLIGRTSVSCAEEDLDDALARSVEVARYWQEADGADLVAADPRVQAALTSIAGRVVAHPASRWWRRGFTARQWAIAFEGDEGAFDPAPDAAARWSAATRVEEEDASRKRPADVTAAYGGHWWSHPWGAPHTTGERGDGVPAGLVYVEDSLGWTTAASIPVEGYGRVYELRDADDWVELCRRYPLEVTASRRHDWYRVSGRDGRWLLPDWGRVAEDWDAVHLTAWCYLTAATRGIPIDDEYASVIGGWGPDETYWLTGRVREADAPRVSWRMDQSNVEPRWVRR